jgi:hypothetical protein
MNTASCLAAALLLPMLSHAQGAQRAAVGLEIPAPAPPSRGHFLTGAYLSNNFVLPATARAAYGNGYVVQPYLRYQFGSGKAGVTRPFVQYSFAPYLLPAYGTASGLGRGAYGVPENLGFAPLPLGRAPYGSVGGLGAFSVGIPMRTGRGSAVLNIAGSLLEGVLWNDWR